MRRVLLALAVCLGFQLILPPPAQAWWGWWDQLSGPKFWGVEIETRLVCLGGVMKPSVNVLLESAGREASLAAELSKEVDLPTVVMTGVTELDQSVKTLTPENLATAHELRDKAIDLVKRVGPACSGREEKCTDESKRTLRLMRAALNRLERDLGDAVSLHRGEPQRFASAGVALSACSFEKDEKRRASIDLTYRLLWSRGDTRSDFAGGNEVRLTTFTPGMSWRPLIGLANGRADWVDLGAGAGIYWLTSDGARPGGFDTITGMILEPLRVDVHGPSKFASRREAWAKVLSAASFRLGWAIFPAGFDANAFGMTTKPEQSERIMGEWVHHWGVFFDPIRAIHLLSAKD
jgi:hypothetical protein